VRETKEANDFCEKKNMRVKSLDEHVEFQIASDIDENDIS
jgi:hypothetical protein